ncbi:hypothetical protein [Rhizobacter sp. Root1221]|uniref:hypothetical protein n=1 Tax=Rhizobacter sp. Root1221 TaxID=1736433 RepID=UPI000B0E0B3A|nr:hypothetical protein [Rhizobacter sp. Root1221]
MNVRIACLRQVIFLAAAASIAASGVHAQPGVPAPQSQTSASADVGTQTAIARVQLPKSPPSACKGDGGLTASATMNGCTPAACNATRQSAIAKLRGQVDPVCSNFVRADADCVSKGC